MRQKSNLITRKGLRILLASLVFAGSAGLSWGGNSDTSFQDALPGQVKVLETNSKVVVQECSVDLGQSSFVLQDVRIKGRGKMEDQNYTQEDIWEHTPRGLCFVKQKDKILCTLFGLHKFSWGWDFLKGEKKSAVQSAPSITLYPMEKENGDAFHVTAFRVKNSQNEQESDNKGEVFWVSGSKNVHLIVRDSHIQEDLGNAVYQTERFQYAKLFSEVFFDGFKENRSKIYDFLITNKVTLVGEAILPEKAHLVDYGDERSVRFFAITKPQSSDKNLLAYNPMEAQGHFKELGLKSAEIKAPVQIKVDEVSFDENDGIAVRSEKYDQLVKEIARRSNSEGAVLYMTIKDESGKERVVALNKCKSIPYILGRMLREVCCDSKNQPADAQKLFLSRFSVFLQSKFLAFKDKNHPYLPRFQGDKGNWSKEDQEIYEAWFEEGISFEEFSNFIAQKKLNIVPAKQDMMLSNIEEGVAQNWFNKEKIEQLMALLHAKNDDGHTMVSLRNIKDHWLSIRTQCFNDDLKEVTITINGEQKSFPKNTAK